MSIFLWILQLLLAIMFLMAGAMKMMSPKDKLYEKMTWVEDFSSTQIKLIGLVEVLAAFGLILPVWLNIYPVLTPLAALGLVATMLGAIITHARRKETKMLTMNIVLMVMALLVALGRFGVL